MAEHLVGYNQLQQRLHAIGGLRITKQLGLATVRYSKLLVHRKTGHTGRTIRIGALTETSVTVVAGGAAVYLERGTRPEAVRQASDWSSGHLRSTCPSSRHEGVPVPRARCPEGRFDRRR
jgi:hypothetical protein